MSYVKTQWVNGDTITAAKLNNIEGGIETHDGDISLLKSHLDAMSTASASDEGKALIAKTVTDGVVTEWEFGEAGGGGAPEIVCNASGAVASFADGAYGYAVKGLVVNVEPIQSGSGDPSPDNVRPISGRTEVTVWRTGVNLFSMDNRTLGAPSDTAGVATTKRIFDPTTYVVGLGYVNNYYPVQVASCTIVDGLLTFTTTSQLYGIGFPMKLKPGIKYHCSATHTCYDAFVVFYAADGTYLSNRRLFAQNGFTVPENADMSVALFVNTANVEATVRDVILTRFEDALTYEPYDGQTVTLPLGQTVYGGTVDVTSGEMVVDRAIHTCDGSETWGTYQTYAFDINLPLMASGNKQSGVANEFKVMSSSDGSISAFFGVVLGLANKHLYVAGAKTNIDGVTDVDTWKAWLAEHPLQVVYPLETPLTVQLVGQSLNTLKGVNNVWSDGGNVSVDYVADTKLYIAQLTEPDADMVADANITSGKYFMVGNTLYLATANIASGAAITPGVNCTRTSLAAALNAINS